MPRPSFRANSSLSRRDLKEAIAEVLAEEPDPYSPDYRWYDEKYDFNRMIHFLCLLISAICCFVNFDFSITFVKYWYLFLFVSIMTLKVKYFYEQGYLMYFIDLCYLTLGCIILELILEPGYIDGVSLWLTINGPVLGASLLLQNHPGLHHRENFSSFLIHCAQSWFSFYARTWQKMWEETDLSRSQLVWKAFSEFYVPWAVSYFLFLSVKPFFAPIRDGLTLYDDMVNGGVVQDGKEPPLVNVGKKAGYIVGHAVLALIGYAAAAFSFKNENVHIAWIGCTMTSAAYFNLDFYHRSVNDREKDMLKGFYAIGLAWIVMLGVDYLTLKSA